MGLRRPPRDFYDHLDGDAVVVILALQLLRIIVRTVVAPMKTPYSNHPVII